MLLTSLQRVPFRHCGLLLLLTAILGCGGGGGGDSIEKRMLKAAKVKAELAAAAEAKAAAAEAAAPPADAAAPATAPAVASTDPSAPIPASATPAPANPAATPVATAAPAAAAAPLPVIMPQPALVSLNKTQSSAAERQTQSEDNLCKIGNALTTFGQAHQSIPALAITDSQGKPLLSWRVAILPYLGHKDLYDQFHLNESWDSPHNLTLLPKIPLELQSPERSDTSTNYLAALASEGAFGKTPTLLSTISDGSENTIAIIEADNVHAVPWTSPKDFLVHAQQPLTGLGTLRGGDFLIVSANGQASRFLRAARPGAFESALTTRGGEDPIAGTFALITPPVPAALAANAPTSAAPETTTAAPAIAATPAQTIPTSLGSNLLGGSALEQIAKLPLPEEEELQKSRALMKELYGEQFTAMRTLEDRQRFLAHLRAEADKVREHASDYHELLQICRKLAVAQGDAESALQIVEQLEETYQLEEPGTLRLNTLKELVPLAKSEVALKAIAVGSEKLLLDAYESDQFTIALSAIEIYQAATRGRTSKQESNQIAGMKEAMEEAQKNYAAASKALLTLATNPSDPQASVTAGKYLCLVKGKWEAGLPMLARGNDIKLQVLARLDQEAKDAKQLLYVAEEYLRAASDLKQPFKRGMQLRAARCYHLAIQNLASGLERVKAQKRLAEANALYGKAAVDRACGISAEQAASAQQADG